MTPNFQCNSCGKCCLEGAAELQAVEEDIAYWERNAPELLQYVTLHGEPGARTGDLWRTKKTTPRCKWIKKYPGRDKYYCRIYDHRPQVCRRYPISKEHGLFTGCEGYS